MKIFVTGGTGLLGNTILRQLTQSGHELISLVRGAPEEKIFAGIQTEFVRGDLGSVDLLEQSIAGCDAVIHSAGMIHIGWRRLEESMKVNQDGTRAIATACLKNNVKLVLVGTVNTLAVGSREVQATETTPIDHAGGQVPCSYVESKRAGVAEVLKQVDEGLRASIVHPGFMLGPWDWKPSSGRMMVELAKNWTPIAPAGGCSVCDSRDVAAGVIAAIDRGGDDGRQYILAGHNWTYRKLWDEISVRVGTSKPIMTAGPVQLWVGGACGDMWAKITGNEGDMNSAGVKMSSQFHWYDSTRAKDELGYQVREASESLDAGADFIKEHHL